MITIFRKLQVPLALLLLFTVAACAGKQRKLPMPEDKATRLLYKDFLSVVDEQAIEDWYIDEIAVEKSLQAAMRPACTAGTALVEQTIAFIDQQLAKQGSIEDLVAKYGNPENFTNELRVYRASLVANRARQLLDKGSCPVWARSETPYRGINNNYRKRFTHLQTGLRLVSQTRSSTKLGTGFAVRILGGYGLTETGNLLAGIELGAASRFEAVAQETTIIILTGALPLVYRYKTENVSFDIEAGPAFYYENIFQDVMVGGRIGLGFSPTTLRMGPISPKLFFNIIYEYFPAQRGLPRQHQVGVGAMVAVSFREVAPF